jgi:beta-glucosidase
MMTVLPRSVRCLLTFAALTIGVLSARLPGSSPQLLPYQDPAVPLSSRVADLVSRMTLAEKIAQMQHAAPAIPRLDVPAYNWWNEALHGVARAGVATVFPQAIGLAATWDARLLNEIASVIGDEARAKHHEFVRNGQRGIYQGLTFFSPNVNIFRDPRWGRGQETYGEDPYLTSRMGVAFVRGLQGDDPHYLKAVATPKHFAVHSGPEALRHEFNAVVDGRDLRETYLPAFEAAVREGGALSVMCAYNRYDGEPCCGSTQLLTTILRKEWGFAGYVVSDCGALSDFVQGHKIVSTPVEAAGRALGAGLDLTCGPEFGTLAEAVKNGSVTESDINTAVTRLFTARFRLGMFDPPASVPYARIPYSVNDSAEHKALAAQAARESIVLLKNDQQTLPFAANLDSIAVIGPNADDVGVLLGNYNGTPSKPVTVLAGVRSHVSWGTKVLQASGSLLVDGLVAATAIPSSALEPPAKPGTEGLMGEYFGNADLAGQPVLTRTDGRIDFDRRSEWPGAPVSPNGFSVRWTGELTAPKTGQYSLIVAGNDGARLYLDGALVIDDWHAGSDRTRRYDVKLVSGAARQLRLEYYSASGRAACALKWLPPSGDLLIEAQMAASKADAIVMVLGLSPRLEGEAMDVPAEGFRGGDRIDLGLPKPQQQLLESMLLYRKPVALVLLNGSAVAVNWAAEHVPAILTAWYPGEEGGSAVADVLFGNYNPAGRLPVTFYRSAADLPPFEDYRMQGRTYRYFTGVPLFPFGHGLSYSRFSYSGLRLSSSRIRPDETVQVTVNVKNDGSRAGDEVVQLYVKDEAASVPVPIRSLQGFSRVSLAPGEQKTITFTLTPTALSVVDKDMRRVVEPGFFTVEVGGKQPGFRGVADARTTEVVRTRLEVVGG